MNRSKHFLGFLLLLVICSLVLATVESDIKALTGAKTRIVWCIDNGTDWRGYDANDKLYGLDTDDGKGIRQICPNGDCGQSGYTKPHFTSDGNRVVYSDRAARKVYVVNFDGTNKKEIAGGLAACVVNVDGIEWAYIRTGNGGYGGKPIKRFNIDNPAQNELVWDKTNVDNEHQIWFTVSGDGKRAAATWPWNTAGNAVLPNGALNKKGTGCWVGMAPDNSYTWWIFQDSHIKVEIYNASNSPIATVSLNSHPKVSGKEVYYPRWSNKKEFLIMSGPFTFGSAKQNIFLGKFASNLKSVSEWIEVTNDNNKNLYPNVWIASGPSSPDPVIKLTPTSLSFAATVTGANPPAQNIKVENSGNGTLPAVSTQIQYTKGTGWLTVTKSGSGNTQTLSNAIQIGALDTGTYSATVTVSATECTSKTYAVSVTVSEAFTGESIKMNAGGTTVSGWESQALYATGGADFTTAATIDVSGVTDPAPMAVYQACRHTTAAAGPPSFTFANVLDGTYKVRLHFADPGTQAAQGDRQMNVTIEDEVVLSNYDIVGSVGSSLKADVKEFTVVVSDGNGMTIALDKGTGNDAFVCGIEIISKGTKAKPSATEAQAATAPVLRITRQGAATYLFTVGLEPEFGPARFTIVDVKGQVLWNQALLSQHHGSRVIQWRVPKSLSRGIFMATVSQGTRASKQKFVVIQ